MDIKNLKNMVSDTSHLKEKTLKKILTSTIDTIEENKTQIFDIYETANSEVEECKRALAVMKIEVGKTIDRVDALTKQEQTEKQNLILVSSNFQDYSEEKIRACYEQVKNVQVALGIERDKEKNLRLERDRLEIRLKNLGIMLAQAEHLALAIGSVLHYLATQVSGVVWQIETVQKENFVGARIIKAQEEERYRISREMHDGPAQDLANIIFQASVCERLVDFDPEEAKVSLQEMRQQIRNCLTDVRKVIFDMRPMALDDLGLCSAVHQLIDKLRTRGTVNAKFSVDGKEYQLSKHLEIAVFRIVQEALNNVAKHAGTTKARVRMLYTPTTLNVLIEDRGKGFDVDAQTEAEKHAPDNETDDYQEGHFGLMSMRERAKIIGAEFSVTSKLGKGTKVHLRIVIKNDDIAHPVHRQSKPKHTKQTQHAK